MAKAAAKAAFSAGEKERIASSFLSKALTRKIFVNSGFTESVLEGY